MSFDNWEVTLNQKPKNYCLTEGRILSEAELKLILKTIRPFMEQTVRTKTNLHYVNDYYLFLFGSLSGLRVSEVVNLKISDIDENSIRVIGKGDKMRVVPLGRKSKSTLQDFLRLKREILNQMTEPNQLLFLNRTKKPFTRFAINRRFDYWRRRCGIARQINYHSLRHYFATFLLNNGFLIHEVQRFLGHSSPATTSQYLHFCKQTQDRIDSVL
jgi:integrase/recombinase XerC